MGNSLFEDAITPDGTTLYVVNRNNNSVTPINVATNTAGTPIPARVRLVAADGLRTCWGVNRRWPIVLTYSTTRRSQQEVSRRCSPVRGD